MCDGLILDSDCWGHSFVVHHNDLHLQGGFKSVSNAW